MKRSRLNRGTSRLRRRTRLVAKTELQRRTPLREVSKQRAQVASTPVRRDTGPDRSTRALVLERDDYRCFCCGAPILGREYSLQHRDSRGMGGSSDPAKNSPANLITMTGSATTEHHGRVEQRLPGDNVAGYWLKTGQDPATTRVWHWLFGWVLLDHDGGITQVGGEPA